MKLMIILILTLSLLSTCLVVVLAAPTNSNNNNKRDATSKYPYGLDIADDNSNLEDNNLFSYDPNQKQIIYESTARVNNKIKSDSYTDLERESSSSNKQSKFVPPAEPKEVLAAEGVSPNIDKIKDIAYNSREVRLVGPNQKEVEMKDDMATKVVVALENLQKEASDVWSQVNDKLDKGWTEIRRSEVWGQVNEKLDKGWTDFKSMVEGVVAPSTKSKKQN